MAPADPAPSDAGTRCAPRTSWRRRATAPRPTAKPPVRGRRPGSRSEHRSSLEQRLPIDRLGLALPVVQSLRDLLGVSLMIQLKKAVQNLPLSGRADRVPNLPAYLVETVIQATDRRDPVFPPVRANRCPIDLTVDSAKLLDVRIRAGPVEDKVVGRSQAGLP